MNAKNEYVKVTISSIMLTKQTTNTALMMSVFTNRDRPVGQRSASFLSLVVDTTIAVWPLSDNYVYGKTES